MLLWCAAYAGIDRRTSSARETAPRAAVLKRFDDAAQLGMHDGRAVLGMWLIDDATEQADVIRVFGSVPAAITARHEAYLARTTATN